MSGPRLEGNVLVTGGAGFLGRAILRRAEREAWPCRFTVYSRDEEKQFRLRQRFPGLDLHTVLGDVRDYHSLWSRMQHQDIVIHAAAVKFIPEAEHNALECVKVNVDGAKNVLRAAAWCGVRKVVGISTDKACLPVNVYGMTKALMERLFAETDGRGDGTRLMCVRYGNVVGSTGSIIPVFREQLRRDGRVRVTAPEMTRFWLSADQAVDLILQAIHLLDDSQRHSEVLVPRCPAMRIGKLAEIVADGAPIDVTGPRPGEKLHESLIHSAESMRCEHRGDYFLVRPTAQAGQGEPWTYSSHSPSRWIEADEMRELIADAEQI